MKAVISQLSNQAEQPGANLSDDLAHSKTGKIESLPNMNLSKFSVSPLADKRAFRTRTWHAKTEQEAAL